MSLSLLFIVFGLLLALVVVGILLRRMTSGPRPRSNFTEIRVCGACVAPLPDAAEVCPRCGRSDATRTMTLAEFIATTDRSPDS